MSKNKDEQAQPCDVIPGINKELADEELESATGGIVYPVNGGTYPFKTDAEPRRLESATHLITGN